MHQSNLSKLLLLLRVRETQLAPSATSRLNLKHRSIRFPNSNPDQTSQIIRRRPAPSICSFPLIYFGICAFCSECLSVHCHLVTDCNGPCLGYMSLQNFAVFRPLHSASKVRGPVRIFAGLVQRTRSQAHNRTVSAELDCD